jgi:(p)ppGpp synthase/HD superfamily hydrolase
VVAPTGQANQPLKEKTMTTIESAIAFALDRHAGQVDKQGEPYILHLLRVMLAVEGHDARVCAILHDVLEDTDCQISDLLAIKCNWTQINAILLLTRKPGLAYTAYVEQLKGDPLAVQVKIADLHDNLGRIDGLSQADQERLRPRYEEALEFLISL